jgi:hypothetical protein
MARELLCFRVEAWRGSRRDDHAVQEERAVMLFTLAVVLCLLWALGLLTSYTMGGFIHLLLVLALVVVLVRVIQGRRVTG